MDTDGASEVSACEVAIVVVIVVSEDAGGRASEGVREGGANNIGE